MRDRHLRVRTCHLKWGRVLSAFLFTLLFGALDHAAGILGFSFSLFNLLLYFTSVLEFSNLFRDFCFPTLLYSHLGHVTFKCRNISVVSVLALNTNSYAN